MGFVSSVWPGGKPGGKGSPRKEGNASSCPVMPEPVPWPHLGRDDLLTLVTGTGIEGALCRVPFLSRGRGRGLANLALLSRYCTSRSRAAILASMSFESNTGFCGRSLACSATVAFFQACGRGQDRLEASRCLCPRNTPQPTSGSFPQTPNHCPSLSAPEANRYLRMASEALHKGLPNCLFLASILFLWTNHS